MHSILKLDYLSVENFNNTKKPSAFVIFLYTNSWDSKAHLAVTADKEPAPNGG